MILKSGAKVILWTVLGVAALGGLSKAYSETISGNGESCASLSQTVFTAATYRDGGTKWQNMAIELPVMLKEAKGNPNSYIKDDEDIELVFAILEAVWASPASADDLANYVFTACMANKK